MVYLRVVMDRKTPPFDPNTVTSTFTFAFGLDVPRFARSGKQ